MRTHKWIILLAVLSLAFLKGGSTKADEPVFDLLFGGGSGRLALNPRFMPISEPWVAKLPAEYPMFPEGWVACEYVEQVGSHWALFANEDHGPAYGYSVDLAPKHIRVKKGPNGAPAIRLRKNLFGKFYYVDVEFELGIFGVERDALKKVLESHAIPWKHAKLQNVHIMPIDPAWNAEVGAIGQSDVSLYSRFEQIGPGEAHEDVFDPAYDDMVMWSGKVSFVTSRSGAELMDRVSKNGLFNFPVAAQFEIRAATFPDTVPTQTPRYKTATSVHMIPMTIPGGLACLTRNFWGKSHTTQANGCEHYWVD